MAWSGSISPSTLQGSTTANRFSAVMLWANLSDGRARFHPLSKKGRSAVWLAWIGCGLHILQISTAASAYRRFLIDTLDSSLCCQHQYTQLQKIFWNNQCLGALKLFCYHLVKWHFQPFLACDLLQKSHKKHYSYSYRATLLHQNLSGYFISNIHFLMSLRKSLYECLLFLPAHLIYLRLGRYIVKDRTVNYFTAPLIFMTLLVGLWTTALHHLIVFIVKTSSTSTREMLFCFFLLPFNVLKSENVTLKKQIKWWKDL